MKPEAFFAPLIRGAIIEQTGGPWTVAYETGGKADGGAADRTGGSAVCIDYAGDAGDEQAAAEQIRAAFAASGSARNNKIPTRVKITSGGNSYVYLTAPDYAGIDRARSDSRTDAWDAPGAREKSGAADFAASRAAVIKNRAALITGGAQGFGEEIVRGLASAGALVFIADLNKAGAEKLAAGLNGEYGRTIAFPVEVNVADEASVQNMAETIALTTGGLDLCVSNAGVLRAASILEQDIASFKFVTDINYTAFAIVTKHCGLLMKAQHAAAPSWTADIIQINSKSGLDGSNKNGSYAGSKFGGIGLVQSFAKELVEYNIKVNAVCPGNFFDGPLWSDPTKGLFVQYLNTGKVPGAKTIADVKAFYESKVPMGRGCTGPDVIRAVLYLVEQIYETGQALPVTGGQVMLS
ncbi:MAG: SDR family NAD(P)-dependent oxidoreductase [Treponema sp.]|jgi:sorbitol-6-phosphate 2-dehydrogenase|nr:SDR family NAD(P)-dependent oxidoreductase [Treponema sp.]